MMDVNDLILKPSYYLVKENTLKHLKTTSGLGWDYR